MLVNSTADPIARIKVIGLGGAGGNAVDTMITDYNIDGVDFMAFNTDAQALQKSKASITLEMGPETARGLGVGGDHLLGAQAAEESLDEIHQFLTGADMVFLTAGMGGGTGTGAIPVIAGVAKNLGALTVAVVTTPFKFERQHRMDVALEGIESLRDKVDTLIIVPNQRLLNVIDDDISFFDAMKKVDDVLAEGVKSIASLVTETGFINVDFSDVKTIMTNAGTSLMGIGKASGENRAEEAARMATSSALLELSIEGATGLLYNVIGGTDMTMREVDLAAELIADAVDPSANIIFGATVDPDVTDEIIITIVATGFDQEKQRFTEQLVSGQVESENAVSGGTLMGNKDGFSNFKKNSGTTGTISNDDDADDNDEWLSVKEKSNPSKKHGNRKSSNTTIPTAKNKKDLEIPAFMRRKK